jgi:tripartite-type tricarboxylate transporter receptor subunit TctC
LAVPASLPIRNAAEASAYFKANSGKINFAASGVSDALAGTTYANAVGFKFENMRYNGGAPATQALIAGDVQFVMLPLGTVKAMADAGRLRIIAVTSPTRYPGLPDVPTVAESVKAGFNATFWNGIYVPAGTPATIVTKLNAAFNSAMRMDEIKKKIGEYHMVPLLATPEQTRSAILADLAAWGDAAKAAGVKPE